MLINSGYQYIHKHRATWYNACNTNYPLKNIPMDDLEQRLITLIIQVRQNPPNSKKWRLNMNQLLREIQQHPKLAKSSHQDYPTALNLTLEWVSKNIAQFEPYSDSLVESLVKWVNSYLRWRITDLYSPDENAPLSLDVPIAPNNREITKLDNLPDFTLSGLDGLIEGSQRETTQRIGLELEHYIEQDPEDKLKNSYPSSSPQCNCQFLSQRLLLKEPHDTFSHIRKELSIPYTTVHSHWNRKCQPILQKIAEDLGYKQE